MANKELKFTLTLDEDQFKKALKDSGIDLKKFDNKVDDTTEKTKKSFKEIAKGVGNFATGVNQGIEAVKNFASGIQSLSKEFIDLDKNITLAQKRLKLSRDDAIKLTGDIYALSETFGIDIKDNVQGATALINEFGITSEEAIEQLTKAAEKVPDKFDEIVKVAKEYSSQLNQIGISSDQFLAISAEAIQKGVFSDKGIDAIKEFNLRLREMTPAAEKALKDIGFSGQEILKQIESGEKTVFQVLGDVSDRLNLFGINSQKTGQALADLFGGAGEDAGKFVLEIKNLSTSLDDVETQISDSEKKQLELNKSWFETKVLLSEGLLPILNAIGAALIKIIGFTEKASKGFAQIFNPELTEAVRRSQEGLNKARIDFIKKTGKTFEQYQAEKKAAKEASKALEELTEKKEKLNKVLTKTETKPPPIKIPIEIESDAEEDLEKELEKLTDASAKAFLKRTELEKKERERLSKIIEDIGKSDLEKFEDQKALELLAVESALKLGIIDEEEAAKKRKAIEEDITENLKNETDKRKQTRFDELKETVNEYAKYAEAATQILSALNEGDIENINEAEQKELESIDRRLEAKKITEEEADKLRDQTRKKAEKAREQEAKENQRIAFIESLINTALAITEALPNIPLSIAVGAAGAIQSTAILSKSFGDGGESTVKGIYGKTSGGSHASGNDTPFYTANQPSILKKYEGGEHIIDKNTASRVGHDVFDKIRAGANVMLYANGGPSSPIQNNSVVDTPISSNQTIQLVVDGNILAETVNTSNNINRDAGQILTENT